MHRSSLLVPLLVLACNGEPTPTVIDVEPVTFLASASAEQIDATLPDSAVQAHDALQSLHAMVGLFGLDIDVQDLLNTTPVPPDQEVKCWQTSATGTTRVLDYGLCGLVVEGAMTIEQRNDQTRLITTAPTFTYGERRLGGGLVFDPTAEDAPVFTTSATDEAEAPSPTLRVVMGADEVDLAIDSRIELDPAQSRIYAWGTASVGDTVATLGGLVPADVEGNARPDEVVSHAMFDTCRCQTNGTVSYAVTLTLDTIDLDLSSALDGGGTLWPELAVQAGLEVPGRMTVRPGVECGEWTGAFVPDEPVILGGDAIRAAVDLACTNNSFGSAEDCERVRLGAVDVDELVLNISGRVSGEMVERLADAQFDNAFCALDLDI